MKSSMRVAAALSLVAAANAEHPIGKVIELIKGLSADAEKQGVQEGISFEKFTHWCKRSTGTLDTAIANSKANIETLTSQIAGEEQQIARLEKQIAKLTDEIKDLEQRASEADAQRQDERDLYTKTRSDLDGTIDGIKGAITGLKESDGTFLAQKMVDPRVQKALVMADVTSMSAEKQAMVASLLQKPDQLAAGDKAAHVKNYNFKSNNIIELLKELQRKFEDERIATNTANDNAENAYKLERQAREASLKAANDSKSEKTSTLADVEADLATHKNELADTEDELKADSATLDETNLACKTKTEEWNARSATRAAEIEAMAVAVKILAKATGVRTEAPGNPVPPASPLAFLQISETDPRQKALNLIKQKAQSTHSHTLAKMAQLLAAHLADPFKDVNNMIEKMIFHLQDEQTQEDNHKAWCDQEISQTNTSREQKEAKVEELTGKIDAADATVLELTNDIADANEMLAKIKEYAEEITEIRNIGKKENAVAIKDAQTAQTALANAIAVLTDFYKNSGNVEKQAWEFVQQRGVELPENPATWDSSYTGVANADEQPGGILTILEHTATEFSEMEAATRAQESEDQKAYDQEMSEHEIEKASRTQEVEMKEQEKKRLLDKLDSLKASRKHVSGELEAVNQYFEDLKPACMDGDSSYEERKAARSKEIEALRQAEGILAKAFDEPEAAFVAVKRH